VDADACIEYVERPTAGTNPSTPELVQLNGELRADLESVPPRQSLPVPNLDYLIDTELRAQISVCMALKNRASTLRPCLESIKRWFTLEPDNEVVIADFGSTDCDVAQELDARGLPFTVVELDGYFSRARGLHNALLAAKHDRVLFLDADMLCPPNMGAVIRTYVAPGECLFPVCWSRDRRGGSGGWRHTGYGMVAIHAADYRRAGGWDLGRRRWGGEDDDFHWHCHHRGLKVNRLCVTDLIHQWHPTSPKYKEQYMDPNALASPRKDWTPPDTRGAVREPIDE